MPWKKMLAWVTGQIDDSLHQKLEFVLEENRLITHLMAMRMTPAATATTETQITRNSHRTASECHNALTSLMALTRSSPLSTCQRPMLKMFQYFAG